MMKRIKLFLIGVEPSVLPIVRAAATSAFPSASMVEVATIEAAAAAASEASTDLLILGEPSEAVLAEATQSVDASGFSRWVVVVMARESSDLAETVTPEDWNPRCLARVFRSVVLQHGLLRENHSLRGDLKTMARRISHELRTPLGCIHTSSDLLEELAIGKDAAFTETADVFRQSSGEITQIIDRVSFMVRASIDPPSPRKVGMGAVVTAALRQLEPQRREARAVVMQPDSWPEVVGVPDWLETVWWNLLHNALQHGGSAGQIKIAWTSEDGGCRFSVSDNGPGIAATEQAGLFVPFEQLHAVRTPGLGLSIVQRLISLQKGGCGYEQLPERGACFYFTLPAA